MNIFIGGSSRENIDNYYYQESIKIATYLSKKRYNLIVGCDVGLLEKVTNIFNKNNQDIMIMEADCYRKKNNSYNYPVYHHNTIAERKSSLISNSNLALFLPGGIGTFDEILTIIESKRAKEHDLLIVILNLNHYYDDLEKMLNKAYEENFADYDDNLYKIIDNIEDTIAYIENIGDNNEEK